MKKLLLIPSLLIGLASCDKAGYAELKNNKIMYVATTGSVCVFYDRNNTCSVDIMGYRSLSFEGNIYYSRSGNGGYLSVKIDGKKPTTFSFTNVEVFLIYSEV